MAGGGWSVIRSWMMCGSSRRGAMSAACALRWVSMLRGSGGGVEHGFGSGCLVRACGERARSGLGLCGGGCRWMLRAVTSERGVRAGCWRGRYCLLAPVLCVIFLLVGAAPSFAADRAMSTRFSVNDNGNITFAANTLMVCPAAAAGCTAARNTSAISSGTNNALNNNSYNMQYFTAGRAGTVAESRSSTHRRRRCRSRRPRRCCSRGCTGAPTQAPARRRHPRTSRRAWLPGATTHEHRDCSANVVGLQVPRSLGYTPAHCKYVRSGGLHLVLQLGDSLLRVR